MCFHLVVIGVIDDSILVFAVAFDSDQRFVFAHPLKFAVFQCSVEECADEDFVIPEFSYDVVFDELIERLSLLAVLVAAIELFEHVRSTGVVVDDLCNSDLASVKSQVESTAPFHAYEGFEILDTVFAKAFNLNVKHSFLLSYVKVEILGRNVDQILIFVYLDDFETRFASWPHLYRTLAELLFCLFNGLFSRDRLIKPIWPHSIDIKRVLDIPLITEAMFSRFDSS